MIMFTAVEDQHNEIMRLKMLVTAHLKYGKEKERELDSVLVKSSQVLEEMEHVRQRNSTLMQQVEASFETNIDSRQYVLMTLSWSRSGIPP